MKTLHIDTEDRRILDAAEHYAQWLRKIRPLVVSALNLWFHDRVVPGHKVTWYQIDPMRVDVHDMYRVLYIFFSRPQPVSLTDEKIDHSIENQLVFNRSADRLRHGRKQLVEYGILIPAGRQPTATATARAWMLAPEFRSLDAA